MQIICYLCICTKKMPYKSYSSKKRIISKLVIEETMAVNSDLKEALEFDAFKILSEVWLYGFFYRRNPL